MTRVRQQRTVLRQYTRFHWCMNAQCRNAGWYGWKTSQFGEQLVTRAHFAGAFAPAEISHPRAPVRRPRKNNTANFGTACMKVQIETQGEPTH